MKAFIRRLLPKSLLNIYHHIRAWLTAWMFRFPARHLIVVGVTGTNGKTTVVSMIGQLLQLLGQPVGWISTATISIKGEEQLNKTKLTTASPKYLQATLRRMVRAGCKYAIIEASSEGLAQGRLNGIPIRGTVFTNLTPEHIESHGSFEKYTLAKERLFKKVRRAQNSPSFIIVNGDDKSAPRFLAYAADQRIACSLANPASNDFPTDTKQLIGKISKSDLSGSEFTIDDQTTHLPLIGRFNVMNALEAVAVVEQLGWKLSDILPHLAEIKAIPGRMEFLSLGLPFQILVDYAPEPASMAALYTILPKLKVNRIIHVFGSAGGGRDKSRRPVLGKFIAERADIAIVTNEDPYDEPPEQIIDQIIAGANVAVPKKAQVEKVLDRRTAIDKALRLAKSGDLVVITGKASEQWIMGPHGQKIAWDDRVVIRELAAQLAR
ncbi:MAG: UDP-N-acetylmuramoyl-L-alanyl-D-glutamate--2,6-diaminopimelate ligase [Patescibacteria group bacterium]|jgi:UDP-N-acetylmuramoyl-L-alanyl-D-glutamate--2,6-diaminopimelate ligase